MHLRSVRLRGFKSFADRTHLELDPGLVAVVGPNGAGKSNLIDALMWALGTQGTRALRLERMEDVIFQGTVQRQALGMAQVQLTFDNSRAVFPLDLTEVLLGRTLFRDGASEYLLNGASCRLLDVQELLAEAGIGRELHAVVAQGQVEEIVQARPEELRSFVEEAAGISKHRRRKERALRKIEQVESDIARAADLAGEQRRQVRPLRAQAEAALRHREVTERVREIRIRVLVGELETLERERRRALEGRESVSTELTELRGRLEGLRADRLEHERALEDARTAASSMRRGLESLRSAQAAAVRAVIMLRERLHARPDVRRRDAAIAKRRQLDAEEAEVRAELEGVTARIDERQGHAAGLRAAQADAAEEAAALTERLAALRDEIAGLDLERQAAERAAMSARAEARAAGDRYDRASERIARLEQQSDVVRQDIEHLDAEGGRAGMTVERLEAERREAQAGADEADRRLRSIESESAVLAGRLESLRVARDLTASRREPAESFRAARGVQVGARGILADAIRVAPGLEAAVEAVLGPVLDALVVSGAHVADAIALAEADGHDVLLAPTIATSPAGTHPPGTRPLAASIEAPGWLRGTIDALIDNVYVADRWQDAVAMHARHPQATFVTPAGRVLRARGMSRPAPSGKQGVIGLGTALERTQEAAARLDLERGRWVTNRDRRRRDLERIDGELEAARSHLHEIEGRIAAAADRLREIGAEEHAANFEREIAEGDREQRLTRAEEAVALGTQLVANLAGSRATESEIAARAAEVDGRVRSLAAELGSLDSGLTDLLTTRASLTERVRGIARARDELRADEADHDAVPTEPEDLVAAEAALRSIEAVVAKAEERVRASLTCEEELDHELRRTSEQASRLEVSIAALEPRSLSASETVARLDIRMEEIGSRLARDHDIPPSRAREEFPPDADLEALEREDRRLDAELRRIGPVNPLAAEEVVQLEQRLAFLEAQLEDLRRSRRDLLKLVRSAEEQMRELLTSAVQDADVRFREVAGLLFPEGDGRLRLAAGGEDPLESGLEIEVRLGRKGHRRLAFLSGGEKALAGLAFLFALHLARPTPFLVLDEVDAPLDDANLGRFLRLLDSLRHQTQVLVVTHQKRTMERADSLVGVTLNPDGTSRVVTQDLREHALAQ
jgi:chromosome segregation protein